MNKPIPGRCLCGAVRFEIVPPTDFVAHCHCRSCRLSRGVAYVTWTSVPLARFRYLAGEDGVGWHRSSPQIAWGFCRACGSSMFYRADVEGHPEQARMDVMYVSAGSLEGPLDQPPSVHYSYEEHAPWIEGSHLLPRVRGKGDEPMEE